MNLCVPSGQEALAATQPLLSLAEVLGLYPKATGSPFAFRQQSDIKLQTCRNASLINEEPV